MPVAGVSVRAATDPRRVLVVGVARSGTTWLGEALGRAPRARFYFEPDNIDADPTGRRPAGGFGFGPYPVIEEGQNDNVFTPLWDMVFSGRMVPVERGPILLAARAALRVPRSIRDPMVRSVARVASRVPARRRYTIVKTIYAVFSLEWLVSRYRPQVIAIQRNPLNVVSSWRELGIPLFDLATRTDIVDNFLRPYGIEPLRSGASPLANIAWHVGLLTHVVGDAVDRHPEWLLVDHEQLCEAPSSRFRAIFDHLGLTWSNDVDHFLHTNNRPGEGLKPVRVTTEQPDRWRARLNDGEIDEIQSVLEQFPRRGWVRVPSLLTS